MEKEIYMFLFEFCGEYKGKSNLYVSFVSSGKITLQNTKTLRSVFKLHPGGNQKHKYVLLVHPTIVIKALHDQGKIEGHWWDAYRQRQIESKELTYYQLKLSNTKNMEARTEMKKRTKNSV